MVKKVIVGFPNWHESWCQEQVGWGTWLGYRCRKSCFGIFIFMIIILSHETISSSLSSLVSTVVSDGKGGLPVGSAPSAIICFHQKQINSERPTTKKIFLGWQAVQVVYNAMKSSAVHFEVDTGHWTGCAMQEDTSQEQSAVDFVENKWRSSTQVLVTYSQISVDNNMVYF